MHHELFGTAESFQDCWDSQGHYTTHSESMSGWCLADCMVDSVIALAEHYTDAVEDDSIAYGLTLTGIVEHCTACGVGIDDVFDSNDELHDFVESMFCTAEAHINRKWTRAQLLDSLTDTVEAYY